MLVLPLVVALSASAHAQASPATGMPTTDGPTTSSPGASPAETAGRAAVGAVLGGLAGSAAGLTIGTVLLEVSDAGLVVPAVMLPPVGAAAGALLLSPDNDAALAAAAGAGLGAGVTSGLLGLALLASPDGLIASRFDVTLAALATGPAVAGAAIAGVVGWWWAPLSAPGAPDEPE